MDSLSGYRTEDFLSAPVLARLQDACERASIDVVAASTQGAIRHLTGGWYSHNYQDFARGGDDQHSSWLVLDARDPLRRAYVTSGLELGEARLAGHPIAEIVRDGAGFTPLGGPAALAAAIRELGGSGARIGLELPFVSAPTLEALRAELPDAHFADANPALLHVRAVKTEHEVRLLAASAELVEGALADAFAAAGEGVTDYELDAVMLAAIGARGGVPQQRFTVPGLGPGRTRHGAGNAVGYRLAAGDVLLVDVGAKLCGMHGDLVRMGAVGAPHYPVADALAFGAAVNEQVARIMRPGQSQRELLAESQAIADRLGAGVSSWGVPTVLHHGLGWSLYEPPFDLSRSAAPDPAQSIDPYGVFEEGMTMSLETAVASPDGTELYANVEDPYVLRAGGAERLNTMSHALIECKA